MAAQHNKPAGARMPGGFRVVSGGVLQYEVRNLFGVSTDPLPPDHVRGKL